MPVSISFPVAGQINFNGGIAKPVRIHIGDSQKRSPGRGKLGASLVPWRTSDWERLPSLGKRSACTDKRKLFFLIKVIRKVYSGVGLKLGCEL